VLTRRSAVHKPDPPVVAIGNGRNAALDQNVTSAILLTRHCCKTIAMQRDICHKRTTLARYTRSLEDGRRALTRLPLPCNIHNMEPYWSPSNPKSFSKSCAPSSSLCDLWLHGSSSDEHAFFDITESGERDRWQGEMWDVNASK